MNKGTITFIDPNFRPLPKATKKGIRYKDHTPDELAGHFRLMDQEARKRHAANKKAAEIAELENQLKWFNELKNAVQDGDTELALQMLKGATLLLERQINEPNRR